ncbi:protein sweetie [Quercus suber]|uniref:Protein sweetie n=1 Tax=Quercus suber TaxID=58331 RepID=A0AAW0JLC3_QUESU
MLTESSRNRVASTVEKEAGWLLLSSLLASMPKEELEDQVFDILSLWVTVFSGNPSHEIVQTGDLTFRIRRAVQDWEVNVVAQLLEDLYATKIRSGNADKLVALSYISVATAKEMPNLKPAVDVLIIKTLIAYQSLPDPLTYKTDHPRIIQLCTTPFRVASGCEESSCLRLLLDKRDAWLGPWIPGRDWFEDELRAFQGGKDGLIPCVWENELSSFPQVHHIH